jgi:hypothetical protein
MKWCDDAKAVARFRRKRGKPSETRDAVSLLTGTPGGKMTSNTE